MKEPQTLPNDYEKILSVDLQRNRRQMLLVSIIALVIAAVMVTVCAIFVPIAPLFDLGAGFLPYLARFLTLFVGMVVYIVLHELVHGVFIRIFSGKRATYGFSWKYAWAGSDSYFGKLPYLVIALSPVVIWCIVLAVINAVVPIEWFWVVFAIQVMNLSGAAGDLYVTVRFFGLPKDILVKDTGTVMTVYAPASQEKS